MKRLIFPASGLAFTVMVLISFYDGADPTVIQSLCVQCGYHLCNLLLPSHPQIVIIHDRQNFHLLVTGVHRCEWCALVFRQKWNWLNMSVAMFSAAV